MQYKPGDRINVTLAGSQIPDFIYRDGAFRSRDVRGWKLLYNCVPVKYEIYLEGGQTHKLTKEDMDLLCSIWGLKLEPEATK